MEKGNNVLAENKPKSPKEIDVFNRFSKYNKLKITLIALGIALVLFCVTYCFAKSLMPYFVTIETYGGLVYGKEIEVDEYRFWQKTKEPVGLKKEGYYIEGYYKDKNMTERYEFGSAIWNSLHLYVNWQPGYAVRLNYAEGEDEWSNASIDYIKTYHEQYVSPGSKYTLHKVYNDIPYSGVGVNHENEQLLWFDNKECTGDPYDIKTFTVTDNIDIYGKWFDTDESKFDVDASGTLNRYLGNCKRIILPNNILKIKDINENFQTGSSDQLYEQDGKNYSAFQNVIRGLEIIYINSNCKVLGASAFRECEALEKVYFLGDNLEEIGDRAFYNCDKLSTITLPSSIRRVGERAFFATPKLQSVGGSGYIKTVGTLAFSNSGLVSIELNEVTTIGESAFESCHSLKKVILGGGSIVSAGDNIIKQSSSAKIYVKDDLVDVYKTTTPWSAYASKIYALSELDG